MPEAVVDPAAPRSRRARCPRRCRQHALTRRARSAGDRRVSAEIARWHVRARCALLLQVPGETTCRSSTTSRRQVSASSRPDTKGRLVHGRGAVAVDRPSTVVASYAHGRRRERRDRHPRRAPGSAPLVALVGQVERSFLGREAFQESTSCGGIGSLATWAAQIDEPGDVRPSVLGATSPGMTTAGPGPSSSRCPEDVLPESSSSRGRAASGSSTPAGRRPTVGRPHCPEDGWRPRSAASSSPGEGCCGPRQQASRGAVRGACRPGHGVLASTGRRSRTTMPSTSA